MPWLARAAAVLETWYPGWRVPPPWLRCCSARPTREDGCRSPSPPTLALADQPARALPGVAGMAAYREGVLVGYRWYDVTGTEPLFPFGYGLSYTRFAYRDLAVTAHGDVGGSLHVAQYRPAPRHRGGATLPWPTRRGKRIAATPQTRGFAKTGLAPGEQRRLTLPLDRQAALSYWSSERGAGLQRGKGDRSRSVPRRARFGS